MNRPRIMAVFLILLAISGCGEKNTRAVAPPPLGAEEAMKADSADIAKRLAEQKSATDLAFEKGRAQEEMQQRVASLNDIEKRWAAAFAEMNRTGRSDAATPLKNLQSIKAEVDQVVVNDCTGNARSTLSTGMAMALDAYTQFLKETGEPSAASKQKLTDAIAQLESYQKDIAQCR